MDLSPEQEAWLTVAGSTWWILSRMLQKILMLNNTLIYSWKLKELNFIEKTVKDKKKKKRSM